MSRFVRCCVANLDQSAGNLPHCGPDVEKSYCVEECGTCAREPFVLVDGEVRRGSSHATILDELSE